MRNKNRSFQAIGDYIFVNVFESETETESGLILVKDPDQWKSCEGEVVSVGKGKWVENKYGKNVFLETMVKEGDEVLFGKYAGFDIEIDGRKYKVMSEDDILGILEEDEFEEEEV